MTEPHLFKACRVCRRQKMRCDGGSPCGRCQKSGSSCIYDRSNGRRHVNVKSTQSRTGKSPLTASSQELPNQTLHPVPPIRWTPPVSHHNLSDDCEILSATDLESPVTAVHILAHPSPRGEAQRNTAGWTPWNQSKWHDDEYTSPPNLVDQGLVPKDYAHRLFNQYMQGCNTATPFFDPVLDTFESISNLSPFAFTIILLLAARQEPKAAHQHTYLDIIQQDAKSRAAETLLQNPCSIDSVEAMLLLAAHSDKTWFGIGHAHQMAVDLGLHRTSTSRLMSVPESCTRYDMRCARLWLFMTYFERVVALGGAREPRCDSIDRAMLESFLAHKHSHPSDIFFCASLELFDMTANMRARQALPDVKGLQSSIDEWLQRWNAHFDQQCVNVYSLHRVHLRVQMHLAKTWQLAILLGRRLREEPLSFPVEAATSTILEHIIENNIQLFTFISQSETYKQFFPWAPTYEVLLLSFAIILGVKAFSMCPGGEAQKNFTEACVPVSELLRQHPCQRYARVTDQLLQRMSLWASDGRDGEQVGEVAMRTWLNAPWDLDHGFENLLESWSGGSDVSVSQMGGI